MIFSLSQLRKALIATPNAPHFILEGEEVRRWANGMFSNNIRKLQPMQGNYSAICDDRGRVQGFLHCYCLSDTQFLCILDGYSLEDFQKRFNMFMILDDIELEELELTHSFVCGEEAGQVLEELQFSIPEENQGIQKDGRFIFHHKRFGINRI